jgi:hypothetical protein
MEPRLINAPISIVFSEASIKKDLFEREYHQLSESEDNAINQWLKLAKARGETSDTDPVLLNLLIELHNKIDALELFIKDEVPDRISLTEEAHIESIGFEHFNVKDVLFELGVEYYGRVEMPVHPKRDIGVFFVAKSQTLAHIIRIHDRDEKEWGSYMTARERVLIREAREKRKG